MKQQKFITSHRYRVQRAKEFISRLGERVSIFDREAFVEFFLLEDIDRLYHFRYQKVKSRKPTTREGIFYQKKQLEKMHYLIYMLTGCIEVFNMKIDVGSYSDVWKAIHEHQLMVAAGNMKYLDDLVKMTETMLKEVDEEALEIAHKMLENGEFMNDLEAHDDNVRTLRGIPEYVEGNDVIEPIYAGKNNRNNMNNMKPDLN